MLFADLEGFTRFSEGRDPREVSEMLNTYLARRDPADRDSSTAARSTA